MLVARWFWSWLEQRPRALAPMDPLGGFASLTVQRLEERRVLSATLASGVNPNVVVDITGNDTVTVSVDNTNHLVIADTDNSTADIVIALADIDSLTFNGDGGTQSVVFGGSNPIDVAALNITNGIEDVSFQQDVTAAEGGVQIHALHDVTFASGAELICSAGDVQITADNDFTMSSGSAITADDPGDAWTISLSAGDDLTVTALHAGLGVTLSAGSSTPDSAVLQVTNSLTADTGSVSITCTDSIHFTSAGDIAIGNGSLSVTAGTDASDTLTMSDGTVFSVDHTAASFVKLTAGGDIDLGEIRGTNLDTVVVNSTAGAITDITAAEIPNITAHAVALRANNGIGATSAIDLSTDWLAFSCTNASVNLSNVGDLTLTVVDGLATSLAFSGGTLYASGSLTIAMETQVGGTFSFIAGDAVNAMNDLTIAANITHLTGTGELVFQAGDDIVQAAGTVQCLGAPGGSVGRIRFTADHEASGADGDRGGITQNGGTIITTELQIRAFDSVVLNQGNDAHSLSAAVSGVGQSFSFHDINALVIEQTTAGQDVTFTAVGDITVTAPLLATAGNLVLEAGTTLSATQLLHAGNQVMLTAQQTVTLTDAADIVAGAGGATLTAAQIITAADITTGSGNVAITGALVLTNDVAISTGPTGSLLITGTVDAQTAFGASLFVSTESGNISVTGSIGSHGALDALEIIDANDVTFGNAVTANHLLQQSGVGTTTIVGAVNTFDVRGIQLTTQAIQFAAGTSSMDSHGQIIALTADAITLPTTFTKALGSTVTLQTLHDTTSIGLEDATQDLNFTDAQLDTIQSRNLTIGSATQSAGIQVGTDGPVSLDVNLTLLTAGSIGVFGPFSLSGNNTLRANAGDDIHIDGSITTATGSLQLLAGDDVTMGATGFVNSVAGDVLVQADANGDANGFGGAITMSDGAKIVVGTGKLTLVADESIVLGQLVSNNATADAISVSSLHGGIVDGGDSTGPNIVAMAPTAVVTLTAMNGIGSQAGLAADAAIETQVNFLAVGNGTAGDIGIAEVDAVTLLGIEQNSTGQVIVSSGGTMTVAVGGPGVQSQGGKIALLTTGPTADLVLQAVVNSRGGDITLLSGGSLTQSVTAPILSQNGTITATVDGALVMQDGALMDAGNGTVTLQAMANVTLGQIRTTNATEQAVMIRSTRGGIVDGGDLLGANVIANSNGAIVTLDAANGIGSLPGAGVNAALETQVNGLSARNSTMGDIAIQEADSLLIRSIAQSAAGNVTVTSVGDLTLVAGQPGVITTTGNVLLSAVAPTANVQLASVVQTDSGHITVTAANAVFMTATGSITSERGDVTVIADADRSLNGNGGAILMANGATINTDRGNIVLQADGDITLGLVMTAAKVSLTTTSGGIVDGGDLGGADIIANELVIRAVNGAGGSNALETAVNQLAVVNASGGGVQIDNNTGGLLTIGSVDGVVGITNSGPNTGTISVLNQGAMTVNGAVRNETGGDIHLQAANNGDDNDDLTINAVITASGGDGNVELLAGHDLVIHDSGDAVDVSVVNNGTIVGNAEGNVIVGQNVVIQSATGTITDVNPVLVNVMTPQITALGIGTITMTVQRPFEIGTVIVIDWGDGTKETFVVTEANQQTLVFEHRYFGPPDPLEPAKDIPLQITVLAPGFTSGAIPSATPGTQQVLTGSYVPNIQFFAHGQHVTPTSYGPLNETVLNTVFKTPGEGLASFAFDLTPPVEYLTFPEPPKIDASLLSVPQPPTQSNTVDASSIRSEDRLVDERVVFLEVFAPDGKLQDRVILSEDVLDNLDGVVRSLPDGHYRFLLREAGESRTRLLQEFDVRQGRIDSTRDSAGDRPPSLMLKPQTLPVPPDGPPADPPADALQPENGGAAAAMRPGNNPAVRIPFTMNRDGSEPDFSRTGRLLRRYGLC